MLRSELGAFETWVFKKCSKFHFHNDEVVNAMGRKREVIQYFGHIFRNSEYQYVKLILRGKVKGERGIGERNICCFNNAHTVYRAW